MDESIDAVTACAGHVIHLADVAAPATDDVGIRAKIHHVVGVRAAQVEAALRGRTDELRQTRGIERDASHWHPVHGRRDDSRESAAE